MAFSGAYAAMTGSAIQLSTLIGAGEFKQVDFFNNSGSAAVIYIGPSTVTSAGVNAYIALAAGKGWGHDARGERTNIDWSQLYVIGTASDKLHISVVR